MRQLPYFILYLIILLSLLTPALSFCNDIGSVQGRILSASKQAKHLGEGDFINYVLRIKRIGGNGTMPQWFTAEMLVENGSLEHEIIRSAKNNGSLCQFGFSRRGMRYQIHEIYLLEGGGFGCDVSPTPNRPIIIPNSAVYYDKKDKVIINSHKSVERSYNQGSSGILIGQ